jgi:hypothetical protein
MKRLPLLPRLPRNCPPPAGWLLRGSGDRPVSEVKMEKVTISE